MRYLTGLTVVMLSACAAAAEPAHRGPGDVEELVRAADRLLMFGRPREACALLERARAAAPANERALRYSFRALRLAHDWKGVLRLHEEKEDAARAWAEATAAVAVALEREGRAAESRTLLLDALARRGPKPLRSADGRLLASALAAGALARGEPEFATPEFIAEWFSAAKRAKAAALHARLAEVCEKVGLVRAALAERRLAALLDPGGAGYAGALKRAGAAVDDARWPERLRWFHPELSPVAAPLLVKHAEGALVVLAEGFGFSRTGGRLVALDAESGRERWRREPPPLPAPSFDPARREYEILAWSASPPAAARGRVYAVFAQRRIRVREGGSTELPGEASLVYAIEPHTGKLVWKREYAGESAPQELLAAAGRTLVVCTRARRLAGLDTDTGAGRWIGASLPAEVDPRRLRLPAANGGRVLAPRRADADSDLAALEEATGNARWTLRAEWSSVGSVASCASGKAFYAAFPRKDGRQGLAAHSVADGASLWRRTFVLPAVEARGAPTVSGFDVSGGRLYVSAGSALRCLDGATGRNLWRRPLKGGARIGGRRFTEGLVACGEGALVSMESARPELAFFDASGALAWRWRCAVPHWRAYATRQVLVSILEDAAAVACLGGVGCLATGAAPKARTEAQTLIQIAWREGALAPAALRCARLLDPTNAACALAEIERLGSVERPDPAEVADAAAEAALVVPAGTREAAEARAALIRLAARKAAAPGARIEIAGALVCLGDEGAALAVLKAVDLGALERPERGRVSEILAGLKGREGTAFLAGLLGADDARTRALVVELLATRRTDAARAALRKALADPDATVRSAAAPALVRNMGRAALAHLKEAREREASPLVRHSIERAIQSLGAATLPTHIPTPVPPPPTPMPGMTREQALARARALGRVLWDRGDPVERDLTWISVEGHFVLRFDGRSGALDAFDEYLKMSGRGGATANAAAFTDGHVWAATTRGALVYDRRRRSWSPYAINLDPALLEAPVGDVAVVKGEIVFTLADKRRFAFDPKTRKWREL